MTILRLLSVVALGSASAFQLPIVDNRGPQTAPVVNSKPKLPLVDTEALQDLIKVDSLLARAEELYQIAKLSEDEYNHPTRVIGSAGHLGTLDYITAELAKLGDYYTVSNQSFSAVVGKIWEERLVLGNDVPESAAAMTLTPATKDKEPVSGDLVLVVNHGCDPGDYPAAVKGNIAFISRGTCPFGAKSELAGRAGAVAAVIYNSEPGSLQGTLGEPSPDHVATFGLSLEDAQPVLEKLRGGEETVEATAYIDADVLNVTTANIIAQTVGGDQDNCIMLGGHSDSVLEGPGINDDGSGTLTVLEVAAQLAKFSVNNCVRFAWWAAEEEGLLGSTYYASRLSPEENRQIRAFLDYDMLSSPNYAYQIYNSTNGNGNGDNNPAGSQELRDLYVDWYEAHGLNYTFIEFDGRSDYVGFIEAGIPASGIATGAEGVKTEAEVTMFGGQAGAWYDPCYHQLCDDVGNVNLTAWEVNSKLVAHSVATFAVSFDGFPERVDVTAAGAKEKSVRYPYRGNKLII